MRCSYRVRNSPRALQFGDQLPGDADQIVRQCARAQPEPGDAGLLPVGEQVGQFADRAGEDGGVGAVDGSVQIVQPAACDWRRTPSAVSRNTTRSAKTCTVSPPRPASCCSDRTSATIDAASRSSRGVTKTTSALRAAKRYGTVAVRQCGDQRLPLRGTGDDGRTLHRQVPAVEVDVVDLVAVDEPPGGSVADLGVVLPAVPEPADHLDVVGGLVEQVRDQVVDVRCGQVGRCERWDRPPAEVIGLHRPARDLHADAGAARC